MILKQGSIPRFLNMLNLIVLLESMNSHGKRYHWTSASREFVIFKFFDGCGTLQGTRIFGGDFVYIYEGLDHLLTRNRLMMVCYNRKYFL